MNEPGGICLICQSTSGHTRDCPEGTIEELEREVEALKQERDGLKVELEAARSVSRAMLNLREIDVGAAYSETAKLHNKVLDLQQERDTAQEKCAEHVYDFEHILEYWNRSENDRAMSDALYHILDVVEAAIKKDNPGKRILDELAAADRLAKLQEQLLPILALIPGIKKIESLMAWVSDIHVALANYQASKEGGK